MSGQESSHFNTKENLKTLQLMYRDTLLYTERNGTKTTGLDALAVRPATSVDPPLPEAPSNDHMSLDAEGLVVNADGTYVSPKSSR